MPDTDCGLPMPDYLETNLSPLILCLLQHYLILDGLELAVIAALDEHLEKYT